jgi:hypothetical protein
VFYEAVASGSIEGGRGSHQDGALRNSPVL